MDETPKDMTSIHPLWLRLIHWINLIAVVILIMSGWRIYNATRFLRLRLPDGQWLFPNSWTLGGWLGGAIQWHFAAMWILFLTSLAYLALNLVLGRFKSQFLPVTPKGLWHDVVAVLKGRLNHDNIRHYNMIQKVAYLVAMADIITLIASGLVLWKSVQFGWLRALLGGYEAARYIHFGAMALMVAFIIVHVVMALLVPKTIRAMIWGR